MVCLVFEIADKGSWSRWKGLMKKRKIQAETLAAFMFSCCAQHTRAANANSEDLLHYSFNKITMKSAPAFTEL